MKLLLGILGIVLFVRCAPPSAAPEETPTLVIASDCFSRADSALFDSFEKKYHAKVIVRRFTTDSLLSMFEKDRYSTGIDVIITKKLFNQRRINQNQIPEKWHNRVEVKTGILPKSKKFVCWGIDPYVCVVRKDTTLNIATYNNLEQIRYMDCLDNASRTHFFTPIEQRTNRVKTYNQIQKMTAMRTPMNRREAADIPVLLTCLSDYRTTISKDTVFRAFKQVQYPNDHTSGTFYDMPSVCIVSQTSELNTAEHFLTWMLTPSVNKKLNNRIGTLSYASSLEFRRYAADPESLMQYHTMLSRMFERLGLK